MASDTEAYKDGVRDGKIEALIEDVAALSKDMSYMKNAIYMLYGAIALVNFLPKLAGVL